VSWCSTLWFLFRLPCEQFTVAKPFRIFFHKLMSPCELHQTQLPCGLSIRCLSSITEVVFAFCSNNHMSGFPQIYWDVLLQLPNNLLGYPIQHTSYLLPCELLSSLSRPMYPFNRTHIPLKLHNNLLMQLIRSLHYPFPYQLTSWFVARVSTTCYFSFDWRSLHLAA